ncbi:MAG: septal ring lytic transglycosylase RlpA family protein, partial [Pseudomonadota bacterium]
LRICSLSIVALFASAAAFADKNRPAPIVYGEYTQKQAPVLAAPAPTYGKPADEKSARVDFVYPGQARVPVIQPRQTAALPSYEAFAPLGEQVPAARDVPVEAETMGPIRITAKTAPEAKPVGRPLSLSSVSAREDATLSDEEGFAGVYDEGYDGKPTANGETFDEDAMTAAHPSLPLPSLVQVINKENGREIVVRVNDRGPFEPGRNIDLSPRAASVLGITPARPAAVKLRYLGPAPVQTRGPAPLAVAEPVAPAPRPLPIAVPKQQVQYQPAPTPAPKPATDGNVFIQVGSFTDISNAQRMHDALGRKLPVEIEDAYVRGGHYFRVLVGPFATRAQAEVYQSHIEDAGIVAGYIVER